MRTTKARKILRKAHYLPHKGKSLLKKVNRTAVHVRKDLDQYVTNKPYETMGLIMLAGICIGFLIHRH